MWREVVHSQLFNIWWKCQISIIQRFWRCHANEIIKTISMIPQSVCVIFTSDSIYCGLRLILIHSKVMTWKSKGYHWSCLIALTSGGARDLCWMRLTFFIFWRVVYGIILGASYYKHTPIVGKSMFGILFREGMLVLSRKYCPPENISTQKLWQASKLNPMVGFSLNVNLKKGLR